MPTTPDPKKAVKKVYDDGMAEVFRIAGSFEATKKQISVANTTAKDLTSMLVAHTLETIEGRTALLSGLIVELNQVIDAVQTKPPFEDTIGKLTGVLTRAEKLFKSEKGNLV